MPILTNIFILGAGNNSFSQLLVTRHTSVLVLLKCDHAVLPLYNMHSTILFGRLNMKTNSNIVGFVNSTATTLILSLP